MTQKLRCDIKYFVKKYGMKMKGSSYSATKGWVDGLNECSKIQRKRILRKIENKYFDYPGTKLK